LASLKNLKLDRDLIFSGVGQFILLRDEFDTQVPRWLPTHIVSMDFVVISSAIVEIFLSLLLIFLVKHQVKVGIALAIFYFLIF
jgi:hypothetical protein